MCVIMDPWTRGPEGTRTSVYDAILAGIDGLVDVPSMLHSSWSVLYTSYSPEPLNYVTLVNTGFLYSKIVLNK